MINMITRLIYFFSYPLKILSALKRLKVSKVRQIELFVRKIYHLPGSTMVRTPTARNGILKDALLLLTWVSLPSCGKFCYFSNLKSTANWKQTTFLRIFTSSLRTLGSSTHFYFRNSVWGFVKCGHSPDYPIRISSSLHPVKSFSPKGSTFKFFLKLWSLKL